MLPFLPTFSFDSIPIARAERFARGSFASLFLVRSEIANFRFYDLRSTLTANINDMHNIDCWRSDSCRSLYDPQTLGAGCHSYAQDTRI